MTMLDRIRRLFVGRDLDTEAADHLEAKEEARLQRLETDPFSFQDFESFARFRRRRGLPTRRPRR